MRSHQNVVFPALTMDLQRAQEVDEVPSVVGLDHVREGGHRSAVHAGHENLVNVLIGAAAFKARVVSGSSKVERTNWIVLAVSEGGRGRTVAFAVQTVTLPAFELGEKSLTMRDALEGHW